MADRQLIQQRGSSCPRRGPGRLSTHPLDPRKYTPSSPLETRSQRRPPSQAVPAAAAAPLPALLIPAGREKNHRLENCRYDDRERGEKKKSWTRVQAARLVRLAKPGGGVLCGG